MVGDSRRATVGCGLLVLLIAGGCGGDDRPDVYEATGEIIYQGQPVEGAQVMFMPAAARQATGTTGADGRFVLSTYGTDDGAVAGEHEVTVAKMVKANPNDTSSYPEMRAAIPVKYNNPRTSGLKAQVNESGDNHFLFNLE